MSIPASSSTSATLRSAGTWKHWPELASCTSKLPASLVTAAAAKYSRCSCASLQPSSRAVPSTYSMKPLGPQTYRWHSLNGLANTWAASRRPPDSPASICRCTQSAKVELPMRSTKAMR
ncbi:hypothetical protein D3C85_1569270 [compost metagenome]